ncbi:hypothetical protein [Limoniibacter endophyticus]|uniref:Uncharacterized protein n=1 Tax=Limoniibacter endophyticus TaxID=1565040 RepID=A0A8J3DHI2_9HYPH|nr:hypothetical protein [Limoniibacter endophyticus]GHC71374.1 hypothetical protein GCM10010136_18490 [Limoniibacter endophyticus]
MKLTSLIALLALGLLATQNASADSLVYQGAKQPSSSFIYRGTSREAELEARRAEEERIASKQALKEMRPTTSEIQTPEIDAQETASTTPEITIEEAPAIVRTEDPISGREIREIPLEKQTPAEALESRIASPEAATESPGAQEFEAHATTPADLDDEAIATSPTVDTESPDSVPTVE